ncbi:MAG: FecR domain-containing protein [Proteobacteria bacterium]|nr:FecR domain-containing protein [Pseudomonadota bacterium]
MKDDWLWDGSGTPSPEDKRIADALSGLAFQGEPPDVTKTAPQRSWIGPALGVALLLAAAALFALRWMPSAEIEAPVEVTPIASNTAWGIEATTGEPSCNKEPVEADQVLQGGDWLTTDEDDAARVTVADLGFMEVSAESAVRLVSSTAEEHRLELARGSVEVAVNAPPRVLVIETPGGDVVDLGCAYTLEVESSGHGRIEVTDGKVAVEHPLHNVLVPEGAWTRTRGPAGPAVPAFIDAHPDLATLAMRAADESKDSEALDELLALARPRDTLTLVHLIERVGVPEREALFARTVELVGPVSVQGEDVVALEGEALAGLLVDASHAW